MLGTIPSAASRRVNANDVYWVDSSGRRNTLIWEVLMGRPAGWMRELTGRSLMKSPGAPAHRREVERLFWREVAKGLVPLQGMWQRWFLSGSST
jgi:hypothetical protein